MSDITIHNINPVFSITSFKDFEIFKEALSFETSYWNTTSRGKKQSWYIKTIAEKSRKGWLIYTGHIPRIIQWCEDNNHTVNIIQKEKPQIFFNEPKIKGITFRPDQLELIKIALLDKRGIIIAPTGSGKTIVASGIISSCPPDFRVVFAVHSTDIVTQTIEKMRKYGLTPNQLGAGVSWNGAPLGKLTVGTSHTLKTLPKEELEKIDMVIVDEVHHAGGLSAGYKTILENTTAQYRIGVTATIAETWESILTLEGYLGPQIGELTVEDAMELGILAKPTVKIYKALGNPKIKTERHYATVYDKGIVHNEPRNLQIADLTKNLVNKGNSVLIFVTAVDHITNMARALTLLGVEHECVWGQVKIDERTNIKERLENKELLCAVANVVWREGIDITTLNVVINAGAGADDKRTIQTMGRGFRRTAEKTEILLIDFFDPYNTYLVAQFGERVSIYCEKGWL